MTTLDRPMSPCKDCETRHEACWGKCGDYQGWKQECKTIEENEYKIRQYQKLGGAIKCRKFKNQ